ncbi:MAG: sigma-70 family RNA polymerase sigma factor, partial [Isosphaeraceae bacterium]
MNLLSDEEVLARLKKHQHVLWAAIRRSLNNNARLRRWVQDDDIAQEVSLRLIRACKTTAIQDESHFIHLLLLLLNRTVIDLHRKFYGPNGWASHIKTDPKATFQQGATQNNTTKNARDGGQPLTMEEWFDFHESIETVLNEREQMVFMMIFFAKYTEKEVAALLDCSDRTVRRDWRDAKMKMQNRINQVKG